MEDKYTYIKRRAHIKKITFGFLRKKLLLSLYITCITRCYYMAGFEMHFLLLFEEYRRRKNMDIIFTIPKLQLKCFSIFELLHFDVTIQKRSFDVS